MTKKVDGVTKLVAQAVIDRDGMSCNVRATHPGYAKPYTQIHHRRPRMMGGTHTPWINAPANLICVCDDCHAWVEKYRTVSKQKGWLIESALPAAEVAIEIRGVLWLLDDDGGAAQVVPEVNLFAGLGATRAR